MCSLEHFFLLFSLTCTDWYFKRRVHTLQYFTGIKTRLNYIEDAGSKIIYIPSMYESNDDDHMAIVHHKKIDSVIGTMDEFDMLRNATKNKGSKLRI